MLSVSFVVILSDYLFALIMVYTFFKFICIKHSRQIATRDVIKSYLTHKAEKL